MESKGRMRRKLTAAALPVIAAALLCCMPVLASETNPEDESSKITEQLKNYLDEALENLDPETAEEVFGFLKEKAADGSLKTEEGIREAIREGEEKFDAQIDEKNVERLVETMEKLEDIGFSAEHMIEKAEGLYQEYGSDLTDHMDEIAAGTVKDAVKNFFCNLKDTVVRFFKSLF